MKKIVVSKYVMFVLAFSFLSGCVQNTQVVPVATEPDIVSLRIAQAAEKASSALDTIAGIEQYRSPKMPDPIDYSSAPQKLKELITVKWTGPIDQMLKSLASHAGMKFNRLGYRSSIPIIISVDVYQKPLIEVFHDIGLQAGNRAEVSVDSVNSLIEIRYASADRI